MPGHQRIFTSRSNLGLLLGLLLAAAVTPSSSLAETAAQQSRVDLVRVQRTISDDPEIDRTLIVVLPTPAPVVAAVAAGQPASTDDGDLQIASVGPAMHALVPAFNAAWPTQGEITTYFGEVGPYSPHGHSGLDVAAPAGTPVRAVDDGDVLKACWNGDGYGGLVVIAHPSGYETWYAHLQRFDVDTGDRVKRTQVIGGMGSTGYSTGPHLHFEVRQEGQLRDPLNFLKEADLQPITQ